MQEQEQIENMSHELGLATAVGLQASLEDAQTLERIRQLALARLSIDRMLEREFLAAEAQEIARRDVHCALGLTD